MKSTLMIMNQFALLSLPAAIVCLLLGHMVYSLNRKATVNRLFFLTSLAAFAYSFSTVMMWMSIDFEIANFWHKVGTIWPFFTVLVLNFALVFSNNKWIKNRLSYLVLYLPAVAFWLVDLLTYQINAAPIMKYWGYNDVASGTWIYYISTIWTAAIPVIAFIFCFRDYRAAKDQVHRLQRKYVTVGFGIPIATFVATNMLTRALGIDFPNLGVFSILFFSVFVGYAVMKYELFTLDASMAAENIISTIPDSLILADLDSNIIRVNERLIDFLGYRQGELIGEPMTKLFDENNKTNCNRILTELSDKKLIRNQELVLVTKQGEKKHVLFSGSIVKSKKGSSVGITCILHDITERLQMEERLLKSEKLASIGELARQVGHDLRNPLAGIKNGIYMIKKKNDQMPADDRIKICEWIEYAIEDSNRIITSLVDYSSDLQLQMEQCTPKSLTNNALLKAKVPIRINVINLSTDEIKMFVDAQKIQNAFASIIQNAIEVISENGQIQISSGLRDTTVEITFTDSGPGIPETILPKLFSPLVTTKAKGMGMSLAICKRVVEAHGGKVTVENAVGKGAKFTFALPVELLKTRPALG
jgi:PAS domain S-box-containing protein